MVPSLADQLLPQLLIEQFDTLPIQCRHIEHMHEGVWLKFFFWQNDSYENLDNYSIIWLLYIQCRHIEHMHEGVWLKIFFLTKWQLWELRQLFYYMAFVYAWIVPSWADQLYHSFWWSDLILCGYNVDTLNICMKEFIIFVCTDSTEIFFSKLRSAGLNYNLPSFFTVSYCAGGI